MKIRIGHSLLLTAIISFTAHAELETFFGENVSPHPIGGPNTVPRPTDLAATLQAATNFYARLIGTGTESFEGYSENGQPTTLIFGTNTATLSGTRAARVFSSPTETRQGLFPITGSRALDLAGGGGQFFTVTFNRPHAAFGFFGTDIEVNELRLVLVAADGGRRTNTVPVTIPQGTAGAFFFGVLDRDTPFAAVEFHNVGGLTDGLGFDDLTVGTPEQVIPAARLSIRVSHVELCWDSVTNFVYQLEYREALSSNGWLPFGSPIPGTGTRFCTNDAILPGQPHRFYQLSVTNAP
jgi:hypothetical protein